MDAPVDQDGPCPWADKFLEAAIAALEQAIIASQPPGALVPELDGHPGLHRLYADFMALRQFLLTLVQGDLSRELHLKGYLAGVLKALQANLRHLTWQTQMIASGDFSQRVDFMGEFSQAFNAMVSQLEENRQRLEAKRAELARLNENLETEIQRRQQTEASLRQSEELYRQLAITDPLTGIFNRRHFFQVAQRELQRSYRYRHPFSVVIFDLDHFKQVNDDYGHAVGDQVLRAFAQLVSQGIRSVDIFARYGGEEFILLLPETGLKAALAVAQRLQLRVAAAPLPVLTRSLPITVSGGVCGLEGAGLQVAPPPELLDQLISQADQALYQAKDGGRNRITSCQADNT
jgi:diguanylate cyclase (GGDEF)-like protein